MWGSYRGNYRDPLHSPLSTSKKTVVGHSVHSYAFHLKSLPALQACGTEPV